MDTGERWVDLSPVYCFCRNRIVCRLFSAGDSLLFAAGIYLRNFPEGFYNINFLLVVLMIIIASFIGNMVGYWFGWKTGPYLVSAKG
jgi:membrane-associated protein